MIDLTKTYKTRDGRDVTQLTRFDLADASYPVRGVVGGELFSWTKDGSYFASGATSNDLIEAKPRIKRDVWVNVYKIGACGNYATKEEADVMGWGVRTACVKLTIDCEEGEGLQ